MPSTWTCRSTRATSAATTWPAGRCGGGGTKACWSRTRTRRSTCTGWATRTTPAACARPPGSSARWNWRGRGQVACSRTSRPRPRPRATGSRCCATAGPTCPPCGACPPPRASPPSVSCPARRQPPGPTAEGVHHRLWPISQPGIVEAIASAVSSEPVVIADGHHRWSTSLQYRDERHDAGDGDGPWDLAMTYVVELVEEQLLVQPIHRLITGPARRRSTSSARWRRPSSSSTPAPSVPSCWTAWTTPAPSAW